METSDEGRKREFWLKKAGFLGGKARAAKLSTEEKKAQARQAAVARWSADVPRATHEGMVSIGSTRLAAAVLSNGKRILLQSDLLRAIGRSRSPKAGTGVLSTYNGLPSFLQADALSEFITDEIREAATPIFYVTRGDSREVGFDAMLLQLTAETYLRYRDSLQAQNKPIPGQYLRITQACDILIRGLARIGITALVDEATGYQADRARDALARILETYLAKELQKWVSTFGLDYYEQLFRLWKEPYDRVNPKLNGKRPQYFGTLTNEIVYERLAPGVLAELRKKNPVDRQTGRQPAKHFQHLTVDRGHPRLREHLSAVTALMKASTTKENFLRLLDKALPRFEPAPLFDHLPDEPVDKLPPPPEAQLGEESDAIVDQLDNRGER